MRNWRRYRVAGMNIFGLRIRDLKEVPREAYYINIQGTLGVRYVMGLKP